MGIVFDERARKAVDAVSDLAKQLITLATGVIAITISFAKDIFGGHAGGNGLLVASWVAYLVCITAGVWVLMAIAGTLDPVTSPNPTAKATAQDGRVFGGNVRIPAAIQVLAFVVATVLVAAAAIAESRSGAGTAARPATSSERITGPGGK
jgi:hypothetical protein